MSSPDSSDIPDPTQPEDYTDIVLVVDGQRLYTCRGILASASPVWRRMFAGEFAEKDAKEIPLPGKTFEDMLELLKCITPGIMNPVSDENVLRILPLAEEYQMQNLKVDCETCLLRQVARTIRRQPEEGVTYLNIAQTYNMIRLRDRSVHLVSMCPIDVLEQMAEFMDLDPTNQIAVLKGRVRLIEQTNKECKEKQTNKACKESLEDWRSKSVDLEFSFKYLTEDKLS